MEWIPSWLRPVPPPAAPIEEKRFDRQPLSEEEVSTKPPVLSTSIDNDDQRSVLLSPPDQEEIDFGPMQAIPVTGFTFGFCTGLYQAAKRSSLVFMAENAHRRPDTVQGWYFYNKTKNYKVLLAGINGGFKTGARVGLWTLAYVGIEYGVMRLQLETYMQRGYKQGTMQWTRLIAGGVAGLGIASGASLIYRLPGPVARRALLLGLITGSSVGALRDAQQLLSHQDTA